MVKYNLTDKQKDLLKELVSLIRSGLVDEEFQIFWNGSDATGYSAMLVSSKKPGKMLPNATKSGIDALERNGLLSCQGSSQCPTYALTGEAYTAIETNFNEYLTPISGIDKITVVAEPFGYVSAVRIQELKGIKSERVDLTKLIRLCEELNIAHANNLNLAVAMLLRSVLDHVPPIFSKASFKEVASGYGGKSFKDTMQHLENGARKIADSHLHVQIRKKEVLPTSLQVNFSQHLDVLLAEAIAVLQSESA